MKIQITTDSTCDLGALAQERNVGIMPLCVVLGSQTYRDGIDIQPMDIFTYVEKTGELPKTAAPSICDYEEFFRKYVDEGKTVVHISLSDKASSSHAYAKEAAKTIGDRVIVVDSKALSSGQGLLVLKAADLRDEGKTAEEIANEIQRITAFVNTSFIPDRLDYLHKGGRCSRMMMYGANILKIHPLIEMEDGQLSAKTKYRGSMSKCIRVYLSELKDKYPSYDKTRCFVTHSHADDEIVQLAKEEVKNLFDFDVIHEAVAGSVISGHCGKNTLGVLFIAE